MILYHGTSAAVARAALTEGLRTRATSGAGSRWTANPSHARCVYLTNAYPLYFGLNAANMPDDGDPDEAPEAGVVEVDVEPAALLPDEDVMEQIGRGRDNLAKSWGMDRRTKHYRQNLHKYAGGAQALASLKAMGTCAHWGDVPAQAIRRVAIVNVRAAARLCFEAMQPTITLMNYQICGADYRALTARIFADGEPGVHVLLGKAYK